MKKKILFRSLLGAPIGVTISLLIAIIISLCVGQGGSSLAPHDLVVWCGNEITAVIVQMLCSLFIGAVGGGSSVIWEIEKWSLLKQTSVHFAVVAVPFFGVSYVLNWMPHYLYGAFGYGGWFALIYVFMWCSIYFSIRAKIKKMNKHLQAMQNENTNTESESK